jgi:hypothetical protein
VVNGIKGAAKKSDVHVCVQHLDDPAWCRPVYLYDSRNPEFWSLDEIHRLNSL